jgi:hypothetical protein
MISMSRGAHMGELPRRVLWQMRALAIAMAVIANVVILTVARVVNGEFPVATVGDDEQSIEFSQVIVVTILVGLAAWGLLVLLERTTSRAVTIWLAIATAFFLISLLGPFTSGENTSSKVVLALMHLGAFTTIAPMMWRSATLRSA